MIVNNLRKGWWEKPSLSKRRNIGPGYRSNGMLGAIGGESLGEAMGKSHHAGRAIGWIEQYIQQIQVSGIG